MTQPDSRVDIITGWLAALEERHLADLTFSEVSRALRALSSCYVERRSRIGSGAALDGAGKRAAFALFYGPLHFMLVRHVVAALGAAASTPDTIVDLGCGTGVGAAAWGLESGGRPVLSGLDRNRWAAREAEWTWRALGLHGRATTGDVARWTPPRRRSAILVAFAANEWPARVRDTVRHRLERAVMDGHALLVIEPLAGGVAPWWQGWADAFAPLGAAVNEWRTPATLPSIVARLDRAAGLDHRELTGRSIYLPGRA
jgi:hypothetical protein